jgi:hypothetical protein
MGVHAQAFAHDIKHFYVTPQRQEARNARLGEL